MDFFDEYLTLRTEESLTVLYNRIQLSSDSSWKRLQSREKWREEREGQPVN